MIRIAPPQYLLQQSTEQAFGDDAADVDWVAPVQSLLDLASLAARHRVAAVAGRRNHAPRATWVVNRQ